MRMAARGRLWLAAFICGHVSAWGQVVTLREALAGANTGNRAIRAAELQRDKAAEEVQAARTNRLPVFSITSLASKPLRSVGITLERGSLGVYPDVGPIPGKTTTLTSPLRIGTLLFATAAQPLSQQYRIGLGIRMARVGEAAAAEQVRARRQSIDNEVRRVYYGIVQAEDARKRAQSTIEFLEELSRETGRDAEQRTALEADQRGVDAQLAQARYELVKLDDPIQTQKQQLNRLMGRDVDTPFEVDPASITNVDLPSVDDSYTTALASRPEIRLARLQAQKASLERRIKSSERFPDVSLSILALRTVNYSNLLPDNVSSVGLQATWDVFDWGRRRHEIAARRDVEAQAELDLSEAEALVRIDVAHQHRRVIEAKEGLEAARAVQSAGAESARVARNRYAQRDALLSDVLKAQAALVEADHRFIQALLDLSTAEADFEKSIGVDP